MSPRHVFLVSSPNSLIAKPSVLYDLVVALFAICVVGLLSEATEAFLAVDNDCQDHSRSSKKSGRTWGWFSILHRLARPPAVMALLRLLHVVLPFLHDVLRQVGDNL